MFTDEQQANKFEITVATASVALQVIDRAFERGAIFGHEAAIVGQVRGALISAIQETTGVNFDQARAAMVQKQREEQAARAAAAATSGTTDEANTQGGA